MTYDISSLFWLSPITAQMHALNSWYFLNFSKYTIEEHMHRDAHTYTNPKKVA